MEKRLPEGDWKVSPVFTQVGAAHDWGMTPSEFYDLSKEDQGTMIAYTKTRRVMADVERNYG